MLNNPNTPGGNTPSTVEIAKDIADLEKKAADQVLERLGYTRDLKQELLDILGVNQRQSQAEKDTLSIANMIAQSARENNKELRETGKLQNRLTNDKNILKKLGTEIAEISKLATRADLDNAQTIQDLNQERLQAEQKISDYQTRMATATGFSRQILQAEIIQQQQLRDLKEDGLRQVISTSTLEAQRIAVLKQLEESQKETVKIREQELIAQDKVNSAMGVTGALLQNVNKVGIRAFGGLGLNLAAFGVELDKAAKTSKEVAEKLALTEAGEGMTDFQKRTATLKAALPGIRKAIGAAFNDPLTIAVTILTNLWNAFKVVDKEATALSRMIGETSMLRVQTMSYNMALVDTVDLLKQASALTLQTGMNAGVAFSKENLVGAADAVNFLGLSNEEAGRLAITAQATGTSFKNNTSSLIQGVNNFNRMNRSAIAHGLVLKDVANASDGIRASLAANPESLVKAASAARRLGLELKDLDTIANSLLDFESSIESELEAQLLTGKQINLAKARELSLNNDLEGLGKELFKNSADLLEYGTYNRIQQEAYAKSLGLSRDQLAKIAYQRGIENNLSEEALKISTGMTEEELRRMEVSVMLEKSITKITQGFAPLLEMTAKYGDYIGVAVMGLGSIYALAKALQVVQSAITISKAAYVGWTKGAIVAERLLNAQKTIGLTRTIATAVAWAAANPVKALVGLGVATAVGASLYAMTRPKSIEDGVISPDGGLVVSGPKGSIQLDKNDTIVAGTNLGGRSNESTETNRLLRELVTMVGRGGNVYIDGNKAGQALVLAGSKST
jgi:hypothetical protein